MKKIYLLFLFSLSLLAEAQQKDTLSLMSYNLLFYRQTTSFCTNSNNSPTDKDNAMKTIIDHSLPDILVVNEMGGGSSVKAFRLLSNALNQGGRKKYQLANSSGVANQSLVNMIYYDSSKLILEKQATINKDVNNNNLVRLIDLYTLIVKDTNIALHQDTTRIHVFAAHLKAGSSTNDKNERADATAAVMAYLDSNRALGNYIFAGDLNLQSSSETSFQNLINYKDTALRFFDPVNIPGNWSNDGRFASLHTQSTHTSGNCHVGGGMDDRFDFILASGEIMNNTENVRYIKNSYQTLGQDGRRFNQSVISPTNNSVPSAVSQALFDMSDHLPVLLDLEINFPIITSVEKFEQDFDKIIFENPNSGQLNISFEGTPPPLKKIEIYDMASNRLITKSVQNRTSISIDISHLPNGIYFLKFTGAQNFQKIRKLVKI